MTVRIHETRDTGAIYAMDRICFPEDEQAEIRRSKWWVARVDGVTAGYAGARCLLAEQAVYLSRAGVLPAYRGQGLQLALIRRRVRWAKSIGVPLVITDTSPTNPGSSNNLIRAGFHLYEPEGAWCEGSALYWRKMLE